MKLKLSTLIVIIALIFIGYYYFIHTPCQPAQESRPQTLPPPPPPPEDGVTVLEPQSGTDVTPLPEENFAVTPLIDFEEPESRQAIQSTYNPNDMYDLAGNVRPDNVMHVQEGVTLL